MYEPSIPHLKRMFDINNIQVYGLLIGAGGAIFNIKKNKSFFYIKL